MKFTTDTNTRKRIIQEKLYEAAGITDFSFSIPQPFEPSMFEALREELTIDPVGLAKQMNQVFAENLANNMSSRIKKAAGTPDADLPTQEDMDELAASYDFTGVRAGGGAVAGSPFDKIFFRMAKATIRSIIKKHGYQGKKVTIAKKGDEELTEDQMAFEDFENEVSRLIEGEGPWAEVEGFINLRNEMKEEALAEEEKARLAAQNTEDKLADINLS